MNSTAHVITRPLAPATENWDWCEVCKVSFNTEKASKQHLKSERHRKRIGETVQRGSVCDSCGKSFSRESDVARHKRLLQCSTTIWQSAQIIPAKRTREARASGIDRMEDLHGDHENEPDISRKRSANEAMRTFDDAWERAADMFQESPRRLLERTLRDAVFALDFAKAKSTLEQMAGPSRFEGGNEAQPFGDINQLLYYAVRKSRDDFVVLLCGYGANPQVRRKNGETLVEYAVRCGLAVKGLIGSKALEDAKEWERVLSLALSLRSRSSMIKHFVDYAPSADLSSASSLCHQIVRVVLEGRTDTLEALLPLPLSSLCKDALPASSRNLLALAANTVGPDESQVKTIELLLGSPYQNWDRETIIIVHATLTFKAQWLMHLGVQSDYTQTNTGQKAPWISIFEINRLLARLNEKITNGRGSRI